MTDSLWRRTYSDDAVRLAIMIGMCPGRLDEAIEALDWSAEDLCELDHAAVYVAAQACPEVDGLTSRWALDAGRSGFWLIGIETCRFDAVVRRYTVWPYAAPAAVWLASDRASAPPEPRVPCLL